MNIDPALVSRFVHDAVKPIRSMIGRYDLMEASPEAFKDDPTSPRDLRDALEVVRQSLDDLRTLSECDADDPGCWEEFDGMTAGVIAGSPNPTTRACSPSDLRFFGNRRLVAQALKNITWFLGRFGNAIVFRESFAASTSNEFCLLRFVFDAKEPPPAEFTAGEPFAPMSKESLALTHNTGFSLYVVRKIAEKHGGTFTIKVSDKRVAMELALPSRAKGKTNGKDL